MLLSSSAVLSETAHPPGAAPAWFLDEIATLTAGTGFWVTDNVEYMSDQEPFDAYGTEWKSSFDGTTISGRLFAMKDGKEIANFWEFRQYWHPQRKQVVIEQFGWGGTIGTGRMWVEDDITKSEQTFYTVGGGESRSGHASRFPDADTHITESFDIDGDVWSPGRKYVWHRKVSAK